MYIIHVGFSGFPKGMASTQRLLLTFKGLKMAGAEPLIINKISHNQYPDKKKVKRFDGIVYINTPYSNSKPASFLKRNINKVSGYIGELKFLFTKRKKIGTAILYSNYFLEYPYYFILSRIFRFKLILQYVEMFSAIPGRNSFFTKINDRLIDRYAGNLSDGVIAISDYLAAHIKKISPGTPVIKIPANSDFAVIDSIAPARTEPYLMYCGTIYYEEVIEFVVSLFTRLQTNSIYGGKLLLIISGNHEANWNKLNAFLKNTNDGNTIIVKSNIPYAELVGHYKGADLLLIPLRNTIQDIARFPHKVGEYTASKRPILSTNLGELKAYFKDGESALLADEFSLEAYYEKIAGLLCRKEQLDSIGNAGNKIGLQYFDYTEQGKALQKFIDQLQSS
jgi:glycosyltransferase involved in cell wall biosynthesis